MNGTPARIKVTYTPEPKDEPALTPHSAFTFEFLDESGAPYPPADGIAGFDPEVGYEAVYVRVENVSGC